MPWSITRKGEKYCVSKKGESDPLKCYDSRADAIKYQRALYANEPKARKANMSTAANPVSITIQAPPGTVVFDHTDADELAEEEQAITAAVAPLKPPNEWFMTEEMDPTPLTFDKEGRVYGHLALWETCHRGFLNGAYSDCIKAPRSQTDYQQFYAGGKMETAEGDMIDVGRLTYDTNHAPLTADLRAATRHYDDSGTVGAFVRARDGKHGIWLSGAVRSNLSPEGVRDMRANPPSGDWRLLRSRDLELVASLAVPVPGLPVTRSQLALAASADGGLEVSALILTGPTFEDFEEEPEGLLVGSAGYKRKKAMRRKRMENVTGAVLTAKKRNALSKASFAIPSERRYPIQDISHARNALARSSGKPEEAQVRRAVCRRYPELCK